MPIHVYNQRSAFAGFVLMAIILLLVGNGTAHADDAASILARCDHIRNPQESFVVTVSLLEYQGSHLRDQTDVRVSSRKGEGGQFLSIVYIDAPAADRGKLFLRNGNSLWVYDPKSKASVRISPRQRLAGNASNGDVVTSNMVADYTSSLTGEEIIEDGEKQQRAAWKLRLEAANSYAPYNAVDLWVDQENDRPLKGVFYAQSGKPLKVAWYRGWKEVFGVVRPTEVVIADAFSPGKVTLMRMSGYTRQDLPLSWFNKEWLPNFTPMGR